MKATILVMAVAVLVGCDVKPERQFDKPKGPFGMPAGQDQQPPAGFFSEHSRGGNFRGQTRSEGLAISWRGTSNEGATTLDAVEATIHRMEFEQNSTSLASDQQARALALLIQARAELQGRQTQTEDGIPILE